MLFQVFFRMCPTSSSSTSASLDRRRFLTRTAAAGAAASLPWVFPEAGNAGEGPAPAFSLGVASGSPTATSVVLWTRLIFPAPKADPFSFAPVALPALPERLDVEWVVARDAQLSDVVARGLAQADAALGHSVHVEVTDLAPATTYHYGFRCAGKASPVGRTRTAPSVDMDVELRLALASCQQYEHGYYAAFRHMAGQPLDAVLHLGDYIYEKSWGKGHVRRHGTGVPSTLGEYRDRYALYKSDPDLQAAHAAFPWLVIWDDHEVMDNYSADRAPNDRDPARFLERRRAAYQAWYEHMAVPPLSAQQLADLDFSTLAIHGHHRFGGQLDLVLLDARQYRSVQPADAVEAAGPARTMLGAAQEAWLDETLQQANGRWTVIAQPTLLSERDLAPGEAARYNLDGWDGYRAARQRLLDSVRAAGLRNPVIVGGDLHAFYAADVPESFDGEPGRTLASEVVVGSITSDGPSEATIATALAENPHLRFASGRHHGYAVLVLAADAARVDLMAVDDRKDQRSDCAVFQRLSIAEGHPGIVIG